MVEEVLVGYLPSGSVSGERMVGEEWVENSRELCGRVHILDLSP